MRDGASELSIIFVCFGVHDEQVRPQEKVSRIGQEVVLVTHLPDNPACAARCESPVILMANVMAADEGYFTQARYRNTLR